MSAGNKKTYKTAQEFINAANKSGSAYGVYQYLSTDFHDLSHEMRDEILDYAVGFLDDREEIYMLWHNLNTMNMEEHDNKFQLYNLVEYIAALAERDSPAPLVKDLKNTIKHMDDEDYNSPRMVRAILEHTVQEYLFPEDPVGLTIKNPFNRGSAKATITTPKPVQNGHSQKNIRKYLKRRPQNPNNRG